MNIHYIYGAAARIFTNYPRYSGQESIYSLLSISDWS